MKQIIAGQFKLRPLSCDASGGGPGGGPRIFGLDGRDLLADEKTQVANFFAGDPNNRSGVRIAIKDLDGDNRADLVVGGGSGTSTVLTRYLVMEGLCQPSITHPTRLVRSYAKSSLNGPV